MRNFVVSVAFIERVDDHKERRMRWRKGGKGLQDEILELVLELLKSRRLEMLSSSIDHRDTERRLRASEL